MKLASLKLLGDQYYLKARARVWTQRTFSCFFIVRDVILVAHDVIRVARDGW